MNIAIDGGPLYSGDNVRGIGVYTRELTRQLKNVKVIDIKKDDLSNFDIVHLTRFNPFRISVPYKKPKNTKFILTIYDLIPLIYSKNYPPGIKGKSKWLINKYLIKKNIDSIITISETSKKDICRYLEVNPDKVHVTYLSAPEVFKNIKAGDWKKQIKEKYDLPAEFALYVGDVNYNKNIPLLISACRKIGIKLVIAGKQALEIEKMDLDHAELRHLKSINWNGVQRLGFVPDSDLAKIYNLAMVYVQPSFYEGFSLPPLQAYECKTPLVISKNQCHVEVFGNDFDYFDPYSIDSLVNAIKKPNIGRKITREYSWKKSAEATAKIYEKVGS